MTMRRCEDLDLLQLDFRNEGNLGMGKKYHIGVVYAKQTGDPKRSHVNQTIYDRSENNPRAQ